MRPACAIYGVTLLARNRRPSATMKEFLRGTRHHLQLQDVSSSVDSSLIELKLVAKEKFVLHLVV